MAPVSARRAAGSGRGQAPPRAGAPHIKPICRNRRATFDYAIEGKVECGIVLCGTEVKSLRAGQASLSDAYAVGQRGELWLIGAQIPIYPPAGPLGNHAPKRQRKLLCRRREIDRLLEQQQREGFALVPLSLYFKNGKVKVELGVARGKALGDKREAIAAREAKREMDRARRR
jgi:SsrA-binding protein